jgi:hypothetical protein
VANGFSGTGTVHLQMYPGSQSGRGRNGTVNDHKSGDATSSQEHIIESFGPSAEIEVGAGVAHDGDQGRATPGISKTVGFEITESRVSDVQEEQR